MELQHMLDPSNENENITSETFYKTMSEWTSKMKNDADLSDNAFSDATSK